MTDVIRNGRQEPLLPGRNEAAGVWQVEFGIDLRPDQVDAIREALKDLPYPPPQTTIVAAGITLRWQPIEPAAAPAEGLREALRELFAAGGRVHVGGSLAALDRFEKAQIEAGAALARHESGSE